MREEGQTKDSSVGQRTRVSLTQLLKGLREQELSKLEEGVLIHQVLRGLRMSSEFQTVLMATARLALPEGDTEAWLGAVGSWQYLFFHEEARYKGTENRRQLLTLHCW